MSRTSFSLFQAKIGLESLKVYETTKKTVKMCSEAFGYVSDNLVTTQMLFCDSWMIFKKFREKKFSASKMNFFRILGMPNFEPFFLNVHKNWRTWLQTALKDFLEVRCTCSKYLKGPPRSGISNAPILVTIRRIETKRCNESGSWWKY